MGWPYKTGPVWTGLRKVAMAEAIVIGLDKLQEIIDELEAIEVIGELESLADLLADSQEILVCQTPAVSRLNEIIAKFGRAHEQKQQ
jgi:hypothetical protein